MQDVSMPSLLHFFALKTLQHYKTNALYTFLYLAPCEVLRDCTSRSFDGRQIWGI